MNVIHSGTLRFALWGMGLVPKAKVAAAVIYYAKNERKQKIIA